MTTEFEKMVAASATMLVRHFSFRWELRKPLQYSHIQTAVSNRRGARPPGISSEGLKFRCQGWFYSPKDIRHRLFASQVNVEDGVDDDESCELVSGTEIVLGEEDTLHAYLLQAVKNNNGTGILLLSDVFGFEDSFTREFAYRVACNGYNVLVPDLFQGEPWCNDRHDAEFESWLKNHPDDRIFRDIGTSTSWMAKQFVATGMSMKLGIIGFCFGGSHLIRIMARDNKRLFGAGVCFYGTSIDPSLAKDIKVPILFINGDQDPLCPMETMQDIHQNIGNSKLVVYHDRGHDFAHRPQSLEEDEDAEKAFVSMRNWLHDFLVVHKARV